MSTGTTYKRLKRRFKKKLYHFLIKLSYFCKIDLLNRARESGVPLVYHCVDKVEAKKVLPEIIKPDSTILVKASRGMALEELSAYLRSMTKEP